MRDSDRRSTGNPDFSVILPTFNRAHVLPRAIDSVRRQSHGDLELLVVDEGSVDRTGRCVAAYRDMRVRYIRHEDNRGQNTALNTGLEAARFRADGELGWVYTAYRLRPGAAGRGTADDSPARGAEAGL